MQQCQAAMDEESSIQAKIEDARREIAMVRAVRNQFPYPRQLEAIIQCSSEVEELEVKVLMPHARTRMTPAACTADRGC